MPFGRQVGRVAIPVKQIEGRIILSQQIVVDDIIPDEVAPPQQVEGHGHVAAVQIPFCRKRFHKLDLLVIDKKAEIPSLGKIDLRGEESGAPHLIRFASGRKKRQRSEENTSELQSLIRRPYAV